MPVSLFDSVSVLPGIGDSASTLLKKLHILTLHDLLFHIPSRYMDYRATKTIGNLTPGENATLEGVVVDIQNIYTKAGKNIQVFVISDGEHSISAIWFSQPYLVKSLPLGTAISLSGKVTFWKRKLAIFSPQFEKLDSTIKTETGRLVPVYPETAGVSSKRLRKYIASALKLFTPETFPDYFSGITLPFVSPNLFDSLSKIHFPKTSDDPEEGRKRLAFDELVGLALSQEEKRLSWERQRISQQLQITDELFSSFVSSLPFALTPSQSRSITEIFSDFSKKIPMNRLLSGDVGSGKTLVAAASAFAVFANGYQTAIMAPTQILAEQHEQTFRKLLAPFSARIALVTGSQKKFDLGRTDIFVGTHALLQNHTLFESAGLLVIDEQHRFGVSQRAKLEEKSRLAKKHPHVLTMTATPIPRTVALTLYGDLQLSTLTELPKGRQPITTWIVEPVKRDAAYEWMKKELISTQSQAYVVCPLVETSDADSLKQTKAATAEYTRLSQILAPLRVGLLHGRMKGEEKSRILTAFKAHELDVLVSTPVVEVGIDVANATIMAIETADRFGLAQLHQLRGRVGRGQKKSYCLLFSESENETALTRLKALQETTDGAKLAEVDLSLRGPGEIFGTRQSGFAELKIARWDDIELIKQAKSFAQTIFASKSDFTDYLSYLAYRQKASN